MYSQAAPLAYQRRRKDDLRAQAIYWLRRQRKHITQIYDLLNILIMFHIDSESSLHVRYVSLMY